MYATEYYWVLTYANCQPLDVSVYGLLKSLVSVSTWKAGNGKHFKTFPKSEFPLSIEQIIRKPKTKYWKKYCKWAQKCWHISCKQTYCTVKYFQTLQINQIEIENDVGFAWCSKEKKTATGVRVTRQKCDNYWCSTICATNQCSTLFHQNTTSCCKHCLPPNGKKGLKTKVDL